MRRRDQRIVLDLDQGRIIREENLALILIGIQERRSQMALNLNPVQIPVVCLRSNIKSFLNYLVIRRND